VQHLLANPELRAAMGAAGQQRVVREFSSDAMCRQMLTFYQEALA
jgi:glycosyltransferase involved in cell wall biosynthesis